MTTVREVSTGYTTSALITSTDRTEFFAKCHEVKDKHKGPEDARYEEGPNEHNGKYYAKITWLGLD